MFASILANSGKIGAEIRTTLVLQLEGLDRSYSVLRAAGTTALPQHQRRMNANRPFRPFVKRGYAGIRWRACQLARSREAKAFRGHADKRAQKSCKRWLFALVVTRISDARLVTRAARPPARVSKKIFRMGPLHLRLKTQV